MSDTSYEAAVDAVARGARKLRRALGKDTGEEVRFFEGGPEQAVFSSLGAYCLKVAHQLWQQTRPAAAEPPSSLLGALGPGLAMGGGMQAHVVTADRLPEAVKLQVAARFLAQARLTPDQVDQLAQGYREAAEARSQEEDSDGDD